MESQKFQQAGFKPDILLETSSTPSIVAMVRSALCCGILPRYYVDPADSRISCFVLPDHPAWDLCISYRKTATCPEEPGNSSVWLRNIGTSTWFLRKWMNTNDISLTAYKRAGPMA